MGRRGWVATGGSRWVGRSGGVAAGGSPRVGLDGWVAVGGSHRVGRGAGLGGSRRVGRRIKETLRFSLWVGRGRPARDPPEQTKP